MNGSDNLLQSHVNTLRTINKANKQINKAS